MKAVRELRSERVALYPPSALPLNKILAGSYGSRISEEFAFTNAIRGEEAVEFKGGSVEIDESEVIVLSMKFDDRSLRFTIEGTADETDRVADVLAQIVFEIGEVPDPIIVVPATGCTVELDFEWTAIYSAAFVSFLEDRVKPAASKGDTEARVAVALAQFQFKYQTPLSLDEQAVMLSPTNFTIGPEPRRPLSDRRFVANSPTRSEEHLRLLEGLEAAMKG